MSKTVYLNISQITEVRHKEIQLKDVADVYCDDTAIMNKCKALRIKTIHLDRNKRYIEKNSGCNQEADRNGSDSSDQ
uniref:stage V sporulation protein AA n=1 Tax=Clostridium sp. NkU-1 TaxID=1095009 RepID=UPI000B056F34